MGRWERQGEHMVYTGEQGERTKELVKMMCEDPDKPPKTTALEWMQKHEMIVIIVVSIIAAIVTSLVVSEPIARGVIERHAKP